MSTAYLKTLGAIDIKQASGAAREVLEDALRQVGFIPNMYANMANAPGLLSVYLDGYNRFRTDSGLTPVEQEVVFLSISIANGCGYCTAAHSMIADKMSGVPGPVLRAIRSHEPIPDARLAALYALTEELTRARGRPSGDTVQRFLDAGFDARSIPYIILAIGVKVFSNYSNHAFGTSVDAMFSDYAVTTPA